MGILDKLKPKQEVDIEEFLTELGTRGEDLLEEKVDMWVKPLKLEDLSDVQNISEELRRGNIVLLNIQPLYKKNAIKLRQAVSELKGTVHDINGDIARISEDKIILTPAGVKIMRR